MRPVNKAFGRAASWLRARYMSRPTRVFVAVAKMLAAGHFCVTYTWDWGAVSGPSMLPNWDVWGDGAVSSRFYRRGKGIKVGDLVLFKVPTAPPRAIKRVAGLPGDYVLSHSPESGRDEMIQVPKGHCWVLGDNVPASRDSRVYGPVPLALIIGKVIYRTGSYPWQLSRVEKIQNPFEGDQNF